MQLVISNILYPSYICPVCLQYFSIIVAMHFSGQDRKCEKVGLGSAQKFSFMLSNTKIT